MCLRARWGGVFRFFQGNWWIFSSIELWTMLPLFTWKTNGTSSNSAIGKFLSPYMLLMFTSLFKFVKASCSFCLAIAVMTLSALWLGPDNKGKLHVACCCSLLLSLFWTQIADHIPPGSTTIPTIGKYIFFFNFPYTKWSKESKVTARNADFQILGQSFCLSVSAATRPPSSPVMP